MELEDIGMVPYKEGNWLWPFFNCLKYKYKVYELKEANPWHVLFISSDYSQRQSYTFGYDSTNDGEKWDLPQKQHPTLTFLLGRVNAKSRSRQQKQKAGIPRK